MGNDTERDPMLDVFIYEANQLIDQLEEIMLETDNSGELTPENINEIFRIMHTIKGSSAMMMYDRLSKLAHSVEDLFFYIRENKPQDLDITAVCDLVLAASDYIKQEVAKLDEGREPDGDESELEAKIKAFLQTVSAGGKLKQAKAPAEEKAPSGEDAPAEEKPEETAEAAAGPAPETAGEDGGEKTPEGRKYIVKLYFEEGGQMENLRAYTILRNLMEYTSEIFTYPADLINASAEQILENGFMFLFTSDRDPSVLKAVFDEALFLKSYEIREVDDYKEELEEYHLKGSAVTAREMQPNEKKPETPEPPKPEQEKARQEQTKAPAGKPSVPAQENAQKENNQKASTKLSLISVNVNKLDTLMNLVGEIVISESMVTRNTDLNGLQLDNFNKSARQLRKLTDELQDIVMSIRMVQIAGTFQKMQRIVRDMSRKLRKDVEFVTVGEDTEVDKNIIDHLSDPLMHLIRNAMDHGVESEEEREKAGKAKKARITLMAQNTGGDVMISVSDDGKGLDKEKILEKAKEHGLLKKPASEMTENEIFSLIMLPGFSTNDKVTEFSGRGVGMDVVRENIEKVGGSVSIKSKEGEGTTISILIPLTLAIADAMEISVGNCVFTLPTVTIKESFRPREEDIIHDNMGNEMIMIRGNVYPIIRLYDYFKIDTDVKKLSEGILIMAEGDNKSACLFADNLLGEQQIVVKPLPQYLIRYHIKENGVEGCTILGNGSISLILNVKSLIGNVI